MPGDWFTNFRETYGFAMIFAHQHTIRGMAKFRRSLWLGLTAAMMVCASMPRAGAQDVDVEVIVPESPGDEETIVEDFTFTERSGRTVTRADLLGKPWLACFVFTRCASTCPKVTAAMSELSHALKDKDVQLVTITVDPDHDTPEVLSRYAEQFRADPDRWWFVTGDKADTFHLLHHSFGVAAADNPDGPPGFQVIHSNNIMHVNAEGEVVGKYNAVVPDDVVALRRVLVNGMETPEKHRFVKPKPGIRIGEEPMAEDLATTRPPAAEPSEEPEAEGEDAVADVPDWVKSLPEVNASLNSLATILLLLGYGLIRARKITAHRNVMLAAFSVSVAFLTCYLIYHYHHLSKPFGGTGSIRMVYFAILITHIILAVPVPFLAGITIYRGLAGQVEKHRRIAKITFPIWLYVSITGVIIYVMLYQWPV
ncbi:hypothetical protein Pan258_21220 [Symmachiella dynata]|nr:hypothetical protein Pan258_21220 [Symmachiella dynata]